MLSSDNWIQPLLSDVVVPKVIRTVLANFPPEWPALVQKKPALKRVFSIAELKPVIS